VSSWLNRLSSAVLVLVALVLPVLALLLVSLRFVPPGPLSSMLCNSVLLKPPLLSVSMLENDGLLPPCRSMRGVVVPQLPVLEIPLEMLVMVESFR
jgi:hypothetical protein